ncbi:amidohydrolase family protein [Tessaracoccus sp. OS52]|uniref:amidohydrolase family protein n=1 Tax=Tessaracoccus sp. OS52 TaxID=2886691 RepID=UPI001D127B2E|nr:amidohydrolase family protein [Tessaracoccus sp. OS52]MCC2593249.1 amidohydrolase family protein [Tessaracoccus sp. OS52]
MTSDATAPQDPPAPKGSFHLYGVVLPETEPRDLWIRDGVISAEPVPDATTIASGCWIVPGLVDAHCHIGLGPDGAVSREVSLAQARSDLAAGTMLVRDAGSPSDTRWVQERGELPRLLRSGRHVARPKRYIRNLAVEVEPEDLVGQVRHEARSGDGWVKLVGDWIDRSVGDLTPLWPADVAAEAIAVAHEEGARVTAHVFGEQAVAELVAAGIDCIEHGTGMSDEVIAEMAARGTVLVPTMINLNRFPEYAEPGREKYPLFSAHLMDLYERRVDTIGKAIEAGVEVHAGTDAGTVVPHGQIQEELAELAALAGPAFALEATSWGARTWLGASNLTPGASADLIVCAADPREHLPTLGNPLAKLLRGVPV